MKSAYKLVLSLILVFLITMISGLNINAKMCVYHNYIANDIQKSSFDYYSGIDRTFDAGARYYTTSYSAKQNKYYYSWVKMKNSKFTYVGPKRKNGAFSFAAGWGNFASHVHCATTIK
ncbi:MAG: hypothetical protein LBR40_02700 [Bacilli bacterium]|jgi:hypothetical protein|nr:hypothetical protein [Bacilli bacterium]